MKVPIGFFLGYSTSTLLVLYGYSGGVLGPERCHLLGCMGQHGIRGVSCGGTRAGAQGTQAVLSPRMAL